MFRARRYRVSLVFAVILVLLILHFSRSHDPSPNLQIPPPTDNSPPSSNQDLHPVENENNGNGDNKGPAIPVNPGSPEQVPQQQQPPQQQSSTEHQPEQPQLQTPPKGSASDDTLTPVEQPGSVSDELPKGDDSTAPKPGTIPKPKPGGQGHGKPSQEDLSDKTAPFTHWKKLPEQYPINPETLIKLPTGAFKPLPKLQAKFKDESSADKMQRLQRLDSVKAAFQHAWDGYKISAMGHDELKPLRGGYIDTFGGWGATLVDTLDTLWIMELKQEFAMAVDYVKKIDFTTSKLQAIPVFETTIRYLGGLLGAYDLSGHKYDVLLDKAVELAEIIIGAFDTPNRMPNLYYKWAPEFVAQTHRGELKAVLAEIGSLSLEFTRLAQLTKDNKYYDAIARITTELETFQEMTKLPGLWPLQLDATGCRSRQGREVLPEQILGPALHGTQPSNSTVSGARRRQLHEDAQIADYDGASEPTRGPEGVHELRTPPPKQNCFEGLNNRLHGTDKFGLGALGDSTYEYLPKEYMLLGGQNEKYRSMYEKAMEAVREHLVFQPMIKGGRDVRFLATATISKGIITYNYEGTHLTCFAGGMVAIGAKLFGLENDLELGRQLTDGCVWAYESTKTGIMPEAFKLVPCEKGKPCEWSEKAYYRALDPRADERAKLKASKSHNKRGPEKGNWHVKANSETTDTTSSDNSSDDIENRDTEQPLDETSSPSHQEYASGRISSERLPPGVIGISHRTYLLRPEAIESVFIMYRLTGDNYWREKGWKMFEAINKYTRTEFANSAIDDVTLAEPKPKDKMESFWLAETLKYFYLLFSDPEVVSLDEYVLNTEAHPFKLPVY